tara:strand:- start:371 stop:925 length:555 start_codon:yes stop_codon:yes gene_type:complete
MTTKTKVNLGYTPQHKSLTELYNLREVITHVQFPEDEQMVKVNSDKIKEGIDKQYILSEMTVKNMLGHLYSPSTLYYYARTSDIYSRQTILNYPKPMLIKDEKCKRLGRKPIKYYYLSQDVAEYIKYVEKLRDDVILSRPQGNLVPQVKRVQWLVEKVSSPMNIKKYKVGVIKDFLLNLKGKII